MQNAFTSNGVIVTDIFDQLICDSMFGGFLNRCPNQELCHEIVSFLAPLQMGQGEPKDVVFATYDEMTEYGNLDEEQDDSFDMKMM